MSPLKCGSPGKKGLNCISLETVKTHVKGIFQKLDVRNRREAVSKAITLNLLEK
jgi:ATP/maltotriose-dependent transcriptional regulator MalT